MWPRQIFATLLGADVDFPLGVADASILAVAERLKICEIASIDRHFRAVGPVVSISSRCCRSHRHGTFQRGAR
jgi:predicted nucleic acid-binding protein